MQYRDSSTIGPTDIDRRIISLGMVAPRFSTFRVGLEQSVLFALVVSVWGILLFEALHVAH